MFLHCGQEYLLHALLLPLTGVVATDRRLGLGRRRRRGHIRWFNHFWMGSQPILTGI
jgi:hypothetical protein